MKNYRLGEYVYLGGGFKYVHPYLGNIPIWLINFQMGWNHQLVNVWSSLPTFTIKTNLKCTLSVWVCWAVSPYSVCCGRLRIITLVFVGDTFYLERSLLVLGRGTTQGNTSDISKSDKRLYFWAQLEYCHELASVIEVEWASKRMLALVLFVLLTSVKVATPWGKFYGRHSRGGLSGAYIIQTLESWMTSLAVVRAALQSLPRSPSRCLWEDLECSQTTSTFTPLHLNCIFSFHV